MVSGEAGLEDLPDEVGGVLVEQRLTEPAQADLDATAESVPGDGHELDGPRPGPG